MTLNDAHKVAQIVAASGGQVVGRTRLQKITYFLSVAGFEDSFEFAYKHYGPFSEELATAASLAKIFGELQEIEKPASWGGTYSIFSTHIQIEHAIKSDFAKQAANAEAIPLELAATAVFLAQDGYDDAWNETKRRKPEKSTDENISKAKALLTKLSALETPKDIPDIA